MTIHILRTTHRSYGFEKFDEALPDETIREFLIRNGIPKNEAVEGETFSPQWLMIYNFGDISGRFITEDLFNTKFKDLGEEIAELREIQVTRNLHPRQLVLVRKNWLQKIAKFIRRS